MLLLRSPAGSCQVLFGFDFIRPELVVVAACNAPQLLKLAEEKGAKGINLVGVCCTGNELMMRHGLPMAGNHLMTELVLVTGAVEMMIVDYQCIMPSIGQTAACYHTKMISTSEKAKFPGMEHHEFSPENAYQKAEELVRAAVENFSRRNKSRVAIPAIQPQEVISGLSVEAVIEALGGTADPLIEAIKAGKIRGAVGVVGCNNPKIKHDEGHVGLVRELIENNVLVVTTGCNAIACAMEGLLTPDTAQVFCGPGLAEVCEVVGIPPVLHMGSCVDNSRILLAATEVVGRPLLEVARRVDINEAVSEALAAEVRPLGIKVSLIEPGAFRTDWATRSMKESATPIEAYAETVGARKELIKLAGSMLPGDPKTISREFAVSPG